MLPHYPFFLSHGRFRKADKTSGWLKDASKLFIASQDILWQRSVYFHNFHGDDGEITIFHPRLH